jgi:predicted nucleic acid-binding protein
MSFSQIASGSAVFIDANTFVYAIMNDPTFGAPCSVLLDRVEHSDIRGFTSADILGETVHRIMTIEARTRFGWPVQGIASRLRRHPAEVGQLTIPRQAVDEIVTARVNILSVSGPHVSKAVDIARQFGLLTGDALIVAVMQDHGISQIASLDADFDRVSGLTRYSPA